MYVCNMCTCTFVQMCRYGRYVGVYVCMLSVYVLYVCVLCTLCTYVWLYDVDYVCLVVWVYMRMKVRDDDV